MPEVFLDGVRVSVPAERRSLAGICAWLEMMALRQRRVISTVRADGRTIGPDISGSGLQNVQLIEAETMGLEQMPLQVIATALEQTDRLLDHTAAALAQMCINDATGAREIWWRLAGELKLPLVTLSLLPQNAPAVGAAATLQQRRWQLEQLAQIIQSLDQEAQDGTARGLIGALETRLWPWLRALRQTLLLQREVLAAGTRLASVS